MLIYLRLPDWSPPALRLPCACDVPCQSETHARKGSCHCCRNDAGLAAAEVALAVEEATLAAGAIDAVGTTGYVQLGPNTMNSVPREARLEIDIRDIDAARRDATVEKVLKVRPADESPP